MKTSEKLRLFLEHADGLPEQGVPIDEIVALVELAERASGGSPDNTYFAVVRRDLRLGLDALDAAMATE